MSLPADKTDETEAETVRSAVEQAIAPGNFLIAGGRRLRISRQPQQEITWEIFRGHLLDPRHVRNRVRFETWSLFLDAESATAESPLIDLLWQVERRELFVTRYILTHGFEAYEDTPGVILSRPTQEWAAELMGKIDLERLIGSLSSEISRYLLLAVVGTSRLPITSLESPLPAYSLGELAYLPELSPRDKPWSSAHEFVHAALDGNCSQFECAKAIEAALRAEGTDFDLISLALLLEGAVGRQGDHSAWLGELLRIVFNTAALSPYNIFAERLIALVETLSENSRRGSAWAIDLLSYMLRQLCRHLTAYDLRMFHNFGANYPDALLLDALLAAYLRLIDAHPELILELPGDESETSTAKRRRRRALRQACLVRASYEGHRVPDAPTSMGENTRVLPAPFDRVPEEQILEVGKRHRTLYEGHPTRSLLGDAGGRALDASLTDLDYPAELAELGMALYLDRPLGVVKEPGEVDRTPLVSHEALSNMIAARRLGRLRDIGWLSAERHEGLSKRLTILPVSGLSISDISSVERPGVVSLIDAAKAATDFVLLRTTRGSLIELLSHYRLDDAGTTTNTLQWLSSDDCRLIMPHVDPRGPLAGASLRAYDRQIDLRFELVFEPASTGANRYIERGGVELIERLQVVPVGRGSAERPAWLVAR